MKNKFIIQKKNKNIICGQKEKGVHFGISRKEKINNKNKK